jgi:hypothetical protein
LIGFRVVTNYAAEPSVLNNPANDKPQQHSTYDHVKDILLPALSLIGTITLALLGKQASVIWAFVTLTLILVGVSFYPLLKAAIGRRSGRAENGRVARRDFPKFKQFVHRYGEFVDTRTNTTLHYIIGNELSELLRSELTKRLGTPNISLWYEFWYFFMQRVDRQRPVLAELVFAVPEFHHMVAAYSNLCVAPIFERLPNELRAALTEQERSKLKGFQQRHAHFVTEYETFAKELSESRPALQRLPYYLPHSNPL